MKYFTTRVLLFLLTISGNMVYAQQVTVSGKVTAGEDGRPLPGVSVIVQGGTSGTSTNEEGGYQITAPANGRLVFSYTGYADVTEDINGRTTINIILAAKDRSLDEVVVVGYGTQRKKNLTGAVSSVKAKDLVLSSAPDVGHMLQGKAAGVMIRQNSAQPGGGLDILIRGAGSINASNEPLIVVDGFPISDLQQPDNGGRYQAGTQSILNSFNPNDIESIDILKDASSTSIYGARAANGVILITTKRGAEGRATVQYSNNFSFQRYSNSFDVLPLNEWMQVRNEAAWEQWLFENNVAPFGTKTVEEAMANPVAGDYHQRYTQNAINNVGRGTDWIDLVTRNGRTQQHNISVTGGTKNTKYLVSGNYFDQQGIISNSAMKRYSFRGNLDQQFNQYVKLGISLTGSRINNDNSQLGAGQFENSGVIRAGIQQGPHILPIDDDGSYPLNPELATQPNPYSLLTITDKGVIERMLLNSALDISPVKGLVIRLKGGLDRGYTSRSNYLPRTTLYGAKENGRATIGSIDRNDYLVEGTIHYNTSIAGSHQLDVLAGVSEQQTKTAYANEGNSGFITDAFLWNNLNAGTGTKTVSSSRVENVIASYFGRLNYNFRDRYMASFSIRTDGASVFARNHKWATFPAVALGWNVAEEKFFEPLKNTISQLKLRAGYGQTGNASIGSNAFAAYMAYPAYLSGNDDITIGVSPARLENPDLKWETTTEMNIGLDFAMLSGRLSGSIEVYDKVISDLLDIKPLNSYHEINSIIANIGSTRSKGFEVTLNLRTLQAKDFEWRTIVTVSKFKDTWKERAPDWKPAIYQNATDPIRAIYTRMSDGIMQTGETVPAQPGLLPGMIKISDIDGYERDANGNPVVDPDGRFIRTGKPDGRIDDADTRMIGTSDPGLIAGMTNRFRYKNFTLGIDFNSMFGRRMNDPNYVTYGVSADGINKYGYNGLRTVKNRWTPDRPSTTQPSSFFGWSPYGSGNFFLEDAWFVRLQNISIGYELPQKWVGKLFSSVNLHLDANNLFVITPYKGVDPETDSYTAAYPFVRTYTIGANFSF
ncbi:MAG: TonB-dependent receptor [Chitinophagaceae bacterium]|nr:TonB-dependent receptor [Chitinophagaceae bacterium]